MKRREFIKLTSQAGAAAGLSQLLPICAWARLNVPGRRTRNLITIHLAEGADVTLGLDPQTKDSNITDTACFLGYRPDEIIRAGNLRFGPAAAALAPLAERCVVINGVSMLGNISHEDCTKMAQTGIIDRRSPQLVSMTAYGQKRPQALTSGSGKLENGELQVATVNIQDVTNMISSQASDEEFMETDSFFANDQNQMNRFGQQFRDEVEKNSKMKELLANSQSSNSNGGSTLTEKDFYAVALAIKCGFVSGAHLVIRPQNQSLDTHNNHKANHQNLQAECWNQVVQLINVLKSVPGQNGANSLFDETLIMVTSEFSRETALNSASVETAGKEHNGYTNSYLLVGGSLQGNRVIGESVIKYGEMNRPSLHTARNFDFTCGRVIRQRSDSEFMNYKSFKKQIQPAHIVSTLAEAFGAGELLDPTLKQLPTLPISLL